jgi:sarcosine oxidase subunit alpha
MYPKNTASSSRLPKAYGLLIDRSKPLSFSFEKQVIKGFEGDTIASALIAEGHWLMSRSFKYHRPRGPLTMAGQDANTLVQLPSAPNTLADKKNVQQDLVVEAQNFTGSLRYDLQAFTVLLSRFLPVGFY